MRVLMCVCVKMCVCMTAYVHVCVHVHTCAVAPVFLLHCPDLCVSDSTHKRKAQAASK